MRRKKDLDKTGSNVVKDLGLSESTRAREWDVDKYWEVAEKNGIFGPAMEWLYEFLTFTPFNGGRYG